MSFNERCLSFEEKPCCAIRWLKVGDAEGVAGGERENWRFASPRKTLPKTFMSVGWFDLVDSRRLWFRLNWRVVEGLWPIAGTCTCTVPVTGLQSVLDSQSSKSDRDRDFKFNLASEAGSPEFISK